MELNTPTAIEATIKSFTHTVNLLLQLINNSDKDGETRVQCQTILPLAISFEKRMRQTSNKPSETALQEFDSSAFFFLSFLLCILYEDMKLTEAVPVTNLWNQCVIISKDESQKTRLGLLSTIKFLTSILLTSHQSLVKSTFNTMRALKCALKTATSLQECGKLEDSLQARELCENCITKLEGQRATLDLEELNKFQRLELEVLMLRVITSLKEGHYRPAQLAYGKLKSGFHLLAPQTVLHFTIDLYNCSVEMFQRDEVKNATEWASIALDCANSKDFDSELGSKRNSIILNTSRLLVRALCIDTPDKAVTIVKDLEIHFPNCIETFLSRFEVLDAQGSESELYETTLMELVLIVDVKKEISSFMFLVQHLQKKCNTLTCLDYVINNHVSFEENEEIMNELITKRIELTTENMSLSVDHLNEFFEVIERKLTRTLPVTLSQIIPMLVWNRAKLLLEQHNYKECSKWLEVINSGILEDNIEREIKEKLQRKLLFCYTKLKWDEKVQDFYNLISIDNQRNTRTLAIMFDYALSRDQETNAYEYLIQIKNKQDNFSVTALAVCIGKARDKGLKDLILAGMESIVNIISDNEKVQVNNIDISSLIRCTIQLLLKSLTHSDDEKEKSYCFEASKMICSLLKQGMKIFERDPNGIFQTNEILWIISKAYNTALHQSQESNVDQSLELTELSLKWIDIISKNMEDDGQSEEVQKWKMYSRTLAVYNLRRLTNKNHLSKSQTLNYYQKIQKLAKQEEKSKSVVHDDTLKSFQGKLMLYNLESTLKLKEWNSVKQLVKDLTEYQEESKTVECGIDLLLSDGNCPREIILEALQIVIKEGIYSQKSSLEMTIKWVRIIMSLSLPNREQFCEEIISQLKEGLALRKVRPYWNQVARKEQANEVIDFWIPCPRSSMDCHGLLEPWGLSEAVSRHDRHNLLCSWTNLQLTFIRLKQSQKAARWCEKALIFSSYVNERMEQQLQKMYIKLMSMEY